MKRHAWDLVVACAVVAAFGASAGASYVETFRNGAGNDLVSNYAGTQDATVLATNTPGTNNYGGQTNLLTRNSSGSRWRFLLSFDLSGLTGKGLTVESAAVVLTKAENGTTSAADTTDYTLTLNVIAPTNAGWQQGTGNGTSDPGGDVTAQYQTSPSAANPTPRNWKNAAGADQTGSPISGTGAGVISALFTSDPMKYAADAVGTQYTVTHSSLTSVVQGWIDNPSQNAGMLFSNGGGGTTTMSFESSEYLTNPGWRPALAITFAGEVPEPTCGVLIATVAAGAVSSRRRRAR